MANITSNGTLAADLPVSPGVYVSGVLAAISGVVGVPLNAVFLMRGHAVGPVLGLVASLTLPPLWLLDLGCSHVPWLFSSNLCSAIRTSLSLLQAALQSAALSHACHFLLSPLRRSPCPPLQTALPWALWMLCISVWVFLVHFYQPQPDETVPQRYASLVLGNPHPLASPQAWLELGLSLANVVGVSSCLMVLLQQSLKRTVAVANIDGEKGRTRGFTSHSSARFETVSINQTMREVTSPSSAKQSVAISERSVQKVVQVMGCEVLAAEGEGLTTLREEDGPARRQVSAGLSFHSLGSSLSEASSRRSCDPHLPTADPLTCRPLATPSSSSVSYRFSRKYSQRNSRLLSAVVTRLVEADVPEAWGKTSGSLTPHALHTNHPLFASPPSAQEKILCWRTSESSAAYTEEDVPVDEAAFLNLCLRQATPPTAASPAPLPEEEPQPPEIRVIRPSGSSVGTASFLKRVLHRKVGVFTPVTEDETKYVARNSQHSQQRAPTPQPAPSSRRPSLASLVSWLPLGLLPLASVTLCLSVSHTSQALACTLLQAALVARAGLFLWLAALAWICHCTEGSLKIFSPS